MTTTPPLSLRSPRSDEACETIEIFPKRIATCFFEHHLNVYGRSSRITERSNFKRINCNLQEFKDLIFNSRSLLFLDQVQRQYQLVR